MIRRTLFTSTRCLEAITKKEYYLKVNAWQQDNEYTLLDEKRLPKKKVALMLGYNGSAYQGMQA